MIKKTHEGGRFSNEIKFGNISFEEIKDYSFLELIIKNCKWVVCFMPFESIKYVSEKQEYIRCGIWDRICNSPQISGDRPAQAGEAIAILHKKGIKKWYSGGKAGIWRCAVERGEKKHETQKPVLLFQELINDFSKKNDLVLDCFMGSGTTALACEKLNRKWIGIEISEKYCEIAKKRIEEYTNQLKLFK